MSIEEIKCYLLKLELSKNPKEISKYRLTEDIYVIDNDVLDAYVRKSDSILTSSECESLVDDDLLIKVAETNDILTFENGWIEFSELPSMSFSVDDFYYNVLEKINE